MIAVQKRLGRFATNDHAQFPTKVVHVLHTRIGATRAERADLMRGITGKDHPTMAEFLHPATLERVDRFPDDFVFDIRTKHRIQTLAHVVFFQLFLAVDIPTDLEIHPPDIIGLAMQQRGRARFVAGFKPEPAFRRELRVQHLDIGDQKAVLKNAAIKIQPHHRPKRRPRPVTGDQPVGLDLIGTIGRRDGQNSVIILLFDTIDAVFAPQINRRTISLRFAHTIHDELFKIGLLQVYEGREAVALFGKQVEFIDLPVFVKHLAKVPDHALVQHGLGAAIAIRDLKATLGKTDRARSLTDAFVIIQNDHGDTLQPQIKRGRHTNGATTHDDHRMPDRHDRILIG